MRILQILFILLVTVGHSVDGLANAPSSVTAIYEVQGARSSSPLAGQVVTVNGIVTGDFQDGDADDSRNLGGFYLQDDSPDGDPSTSDGIFVFDGNRPAVDVSVADRVTVRGTVNEYFGETQITGEFVEIIGSGSVHSTDVFLPAGGTVFNSDADLLPDLERYEGMLVRFPQTLTVVGLQSLDEYGAVDLAQIVAPMNNTNAKPYVAAGRIILDDGLRAAGVTPIRYLGVGTKPDSSMRIGDHVTNVVGNLRYSRGSGGNGTEGFRVMPMFDPVFEAIDLSEQERTALGGEARDRTVSTNAPSPNRSGPTGAERIAFKGLQGAIVGAVLGLIGGLVYFIRVVIKRTRKPAIEKMRDLATKSSVVLSNAAKTKEGKLLAVDDKFFVAASNEISRNERVEGLWLKSLTLADGNEEKQKAIYIRLRAQQLSDSAGKS